MYTHVHVHVGGEGPLEPSILPLSAHANNQLLYTSIERSPCTGYGPAGPLESGVLPVSHSRDSPLYGMVVLCTLCSLEYDVSGGQKTMARVVGEVVLDTAAAHSRC